MAQNKMTDEIIAADQVKVAPRGRKAVTDPELTALFGKLTEGQAVKLARKFGVVAEADRPKVGQTIRKNWKAVRADDCRIDFGTEGIPQVQAKAAKAEANAE